MSDPASGGGDLRLGLLGCGAIAQMAHLPALAKTPGVRLEAICDGAEDLLQRVGRRAGVERLYTDYAVFLAEAPIDAVLLAVADAFHVPLAIQALRAGKHVLVEKPLGTNAAECRGLRQTVRETGLKCQVGCMKRHDPGLGYAREFLRSRAGPLLSVSGVYRDSLFRPKMQEATLDPLLTSARAIKPAGGGKADKERYNLWTQGAHLFDTLRFLGGPIVAVQARAARNAGQTTWHGLLEFEAGTLGHFELTCKACADWAESYHAFGEKGSVSADLPLWFYHRPARVRVFDAAGELWTQPLSAHSNAFANQLAAFARSIRTGEPASPDVDDGLAAMRVLEAVEASTRDGGRVPVPRD